MADLEWETAGCLDCRGRLPRLCVTCKLARVAAHWKARRLAERKRRERAERLSRRHQAKIKEFMWRKRIEDMLDLKALKAREGMRRVYEKRREQGLTVSGKPRKKPYAGRPTLRKA